MDKKYTNEGLPIVTNATMGTYGRDILSRDPSAMIDWLEEIHGENELVADAIAVDRNER